MWAGLGYNRRALYMREVARAVVKDGVPRTVEEWLRLKGIGPYAAAAIYAFSEHKPTAAIDTNVRRVVGRVRLGKRSPVPADDKRIRRAFDATFLRPSGYEILHALMDLGAMICSSRQPNCAHCPLRTRCKAAFSFSEPEKRKKRRIQKPKEHIRAGKTFPDRIYRGRVLSLVRKKKNVRIKDIGPLVDERYHSSRDAKWMNAILERMVRDGLLHKRASTVSLPKT
jgi:A/G-specific adenine glycosylase